MTVSVCDVMCRGFGFVTFANPTSVDKVLAAGVHQLDAKVVSFCRDPALRRKRADIQTHKQANKPTEISTAHGYC